MFNEDQSKEAPPEKQASHTPGPWKWTEGSDLLVTDQDKYSVILWGEWHDDETAGIRCGTAADARLIAAAPDLLEALKAIEDSCPCDQDLTRKFFAAWKLLEAAIEKAEGR